MSHAIVLLPDWKRCVSSPGIADGPLARWWSLGDRLPSSMAGLGNTLSFQFDWPGRKLSVAALSRQHDAADAAGSAWVRADPAYVRADMSTARLLACGALGLSAQECADIARELRPVFGDAGFEFDARRVDRWYLRAAPGSQLPDWAPPDEAIGDDLKLHLPEGLAGKRWRQLFNETQILLHNHPVNAARTARGAVSINSLWFWGAGVLPDFVRSSVDRVQSNRPELLALAALAGVRAQALDPVFGSEPAGSGPTHGSTLFDLVDLREPVLGDSWLEPLDAALQTGQLGRVTVQFSSGERCTIRRAHRWRFWRSRRGLRA